MKFLSFLLPVLKAATESAYAVGEIPQGLHLSPQGDLKHTAEYLILRSHQQRNIGVCASFPHLHAGIPPPCSPLSLKAGCWDWCIALRIIVC